MELTTLGDLLFYQNSPLIREKKSPHPFTVTMMVTEYITLPYRRVPVHACTVRSPLTSMACKWFSRYSKWLDTFQTDLIELNSFLYLHYNAILRSNLVFTGCCNHF